MSMPFLSVSLIYSGFLSLLWTGSFLQGFLFVLISHPPLPRVAGTIVPVMREQTAVKIPAQTSRQGRMSQTLPFQETVPAAMWQKGDSGGGKWRGSAKVR